MVKGKATASGSSSSSSPVTDADAAASSQANAVVPGEKITAFDPNLTKRSRGRPKTSSSAAQEVKLVSSAKEPTGVQKTGKSKSASSPKDKSPKASPAAKRPAARKPVKEEEAKVKGGKKEATKAGVVTPDSGAMTDDIEVLVQAAAPSQAALSEPCVAAAVGEMLCQVETAGKKSETAQLSKLYGEKGLVLFFFPKAKTPGCTKQAKAFSAKFEEFKALGYNVVGASKNDSSAQISFIEEAELGVPLISGADDLITHFECSKGKAGVIRSVIVISAEDGSTVSCERNVSPEGCVPETLDTLKKLSAISPMTQAAEPVSEVSVTSASTKGVKSASKIDAPPKVKEAANVKKAKSAEAVKASEAKDSSTSTSKVKKGVKAAVN